MDENMDGRMAEKLAKLRQQDGLHPRMGTVQSDLEELRTQLDMLTEKLQPVLRAEEPQPERLQAAHTPGGSELAGFLLDVDARLQGLVRAVRELAERVDL